MILVGIPTCTQRRDKIMQLAAPKVYGEALIAVSGALPVLLPSLGEDMLGVLDRLDGLLLDGSPSNVEPHLYGEAHDATPSLHDPARDGTTLPLIRAALARGLPLLAICRGIQELNVALGGSLHQEVHALPGRLDHRAPARHRRRSLRAPPLGALLRQPRPARGLPTAAGELAAWPGDRPGRPGPGRGSGGRGRHHRGGARGDAPGFALGVQFHPEWHARTDAAHGAIFPAFGDACRAYAAGASRQAA